MQTHKGTAHAVVAALLIAASLATAAQDTEAQSRAIRYRRDWRRPTAYLTVRASSAILVDAASGQVLYERNADERREPASTTKIMTAILLLERCPLDTVVVASKHAAETGGSSINLAAGESLTARDLLYSILLRSANDACVAIAEKLAGTERKFAEEMTERAHQLGATNTQFANSNGLHDPGHYTTARDLATIARYACRLDVFNEVTRTRYHTISRSSASKDVLLKNHAKILWRFPGADGIKTGYTSPAGHCFVGSATRNGWRLISVVMNSPDIVGETSALLQYGFERFQPVHLAAAGDHMADVPVHNGTAGVVPGVASGAVQCVVPKGADTSHFAVRTHYRDLSAPIAAGQEIGTVEIWDRDRLVASTPLVASLSVGVEPPGTHRPLNGGWYIAGLLIAAGIAYATTLTKAPRIRRDRLTAFLRGPHRGR